MDPIKSRTTRRLQIVSNNRRNCSCERKIVSSSDRRNAIRRKVKQNERLQVKGTVETVPKYTTFREKSLTIQHSERQKKLSSREIKSLRSDKYSE